MDKENAVIYTRVSTEEQAVEGRHSLNTQERLCKKGIEDSKTYRLAKDGIYSDPGRSATNVNRPGLQDMLVRIDEDKSIKAIFVQDTDRLARNANDHLMLRALFKKHKVKLVSVSQPGIEDSPEGNLMDTVIAGINQFQSQLTGRKTSKSMEERFWSGWFPTKAPMGYRNVADEENPDKRIIIKDPVRAPLIKELFDLYATSNYSLLEVRDIIYKKGLFNLSGNCLGNSQMFQIISNPFYFGEMRWKDLVHMGNHEPITTKEIFKRCARIKDEHNRFCCRKRKYDFLLRGFVFCFSCERRWTAERQLVKNKSYYRCTRLSKQIHCPEKYVEADKLEQEIENKFYALEFSQEFIDKVVIKAKSLYKSQITNSGKNRDLLLSVKNGLLNKLSFAEEKLVSGVLSDEAFTRIKLKLLPQIENVNDEISKSDKSRNLKVDVIQKLLNLIRNLGDSYKKASPDLKRIYLSLFWSKFIVGDGKIKKAMLSDVIQELLTLGIVKINEEHKDVSLSDVFKLKTGYLRENIKIRTGRGD